MPEPIVHYHKPNRITVHCTDTPNGQRVDVGAIKRDHMVNRGWSDIGYHMIIQPDGEVVNGRPLNVVGAHVSGDNTGNIGISLAGRDLYTVRQFDALRYKIDSLRTGFSIQYWEVYTHNQFRSAMIQSKTCPGINVNHLLGWLMIGDWKPLELYILK